MAAISQCLCGINTITHLPSATLLLQPEPRGAARAHPHFAQKNHLPRLGSSTRKADHFLAGRRISPQGHCLSSVPRFVSQTCMSMGGASKPTGVLFVCLGNICRSPTAEAVFRALVEKKGVTERFEIDSCGTGGGASGWYKDGGFSFHEGDPADGRMKVAAATRGVHLTSISRPLKPEDVAKFDVIVGMDDKNIQDMTTAIEYWRKKGHADTIPADYSKKLKRMCTYCEANKNVTSVPDPYYGGRDGFEKVLDLLEDACGGLLRSLS